jgi:DNA helicase-2/ATP-dependent DNA helicase PcrA
MYRTNAQSRAFEEICIREGIPYRLVGGVGFYKRREVRDLLAYLRLVNNGNDKVSFSRIINTPRRGIGKKSLADFQLWAANACDSYDDALERLTRGEESPLTGRSGRLFAEFGADLQRWRTIAAEGNLLNLLDTIMTEIGYNLYLNEISDSEEQAMERSENVQELRGLTAKAQDEGVTLSEFLADQMLVADVDTLAEDMNAVTLLTLHAAKGLEYPVVFITGLEEGLMPHSRSLDDPEGMAEERRLLYVGITRAENRVYLTHAFRRTMWGSSSANSPSRFLADLPENLLDGMSPTTRAYADQRRFREQTRWSSTAFGSTSGDEVDVSELRNGVRGKIVPFPGMKPKDASPTQFKTNDVVTHRVFGEGRVIESKIRDSQEEVTVAFANRKHGIKTILAEYLNAKS